MAFHLGMSETIWVKSRILALFGMAMTNPTNFTLFLILNKENVSIESKGLN